MHQAIRSRIRKRGFDERDAFGSIEWVKRSDPALERAAEPDQRQSVHLVQACISGRGSRRLVPSPRTELSRLDRQRQAQIRDGLHRRRQDSLPLDPPGITPALHHTSRDKSPSRSQILQFRSPDTWVIFRTSAQRVFAEVGTLLTPVTLDVDAASPRRAFAATSRVAACCVENFR